MYKSTRNNNFYSVNDYFEYPDSGCKYDMDIIIRIVTKETSKRSLDFFIDLKEHLQADEIFRDRVMIRVCYPVIDANLCNIHLFIKFYTLDFINECMHPNLDEDAYAAKIARHVNMMFNHLERFDPVNVTNVSAEFLDDFVNNEKMQSALSEIGVYSLPD